MGMIRRADLADTARNALVMDLGDLSARGEALVREANARAEQILRDARAERDRLIATAREEGFRAGHAEGSAKGHAEGIAKGVAEARAAKTESLAAIEGAWGAALDGFESVREDMLQAARTEVVRLAAEIASRVTRRAVDLDAGAVLPQLEAVLAAVVRPSRLVVRVHPEDLDLARAELPELVTRFDLCRHAELVPDASLDHGSCVATTDEGGRIDAGIGTQLDRILSALMPGEPSIRIERSARGDAA
jgi:flagellar assembly protein FliH